MVEYGCNVANKFGFMSDDDDFEDPQELITKAAKVDAEKAAAQEKADKIAAKQAAAQPKEAPKPVGKENSKPANRPRGGNNRESRGPPRPRREGADLADRFGESGRGRGGPRGGRGGPRPFRGRGGNLNTSSGEENKEVATEESQDVNAEGGRERRGGRGFARGGRGGRGRQFDRQSGSDRTGVRPQEKKDGHGKGNWGDAKDELAGETEPISNDEVAVEPETPREKTAEELQYEAELAEFAKMKTLKEFKAAQKKQEAAFKTRQAGEGEALSGKIVPIKKEIVEDKEDEVVIIRKESSKKFLDVDFKFAAADAGRGREGRGRGRGGPRRGGRGGNRQNANTPFTPSGEDFPALGAQ